MKIDSVIKFFGSQSAAADALGVTQPTISNWKSRSTGIPAIQQIRLEMLSKGVLKADKRILKLSHL